MCLLGRLNLLCSFFSFFLLLFLCQSLFVDFFLETIWRKKRIIIATCCSCSATLSCCCLLAFSLASSASLAARAFVLNWFYRNKSEKSDKDKKDTSYCLPFLRLQLQLFSINKRWYKLDNKGLHDILGYRCHERTTVGRLQASAAKGWSQLKDSYVMASKRQNSKIESLLLKLHACIVMTTQKEATKEWHLLIWVDLGEVPFLLGMFSYVLK